MLREAGVPKVEPFLLEVAELVNSTLDLDQLLQRIAEIVRRVIDYRIFAILLMNERTQELRIRFSIGHTQSSIETCRIKIGEGVTGQAALRREAMLVNDVREAEHYIPGLPGVHSELAVPLIVKGKLIGVIDLEAPERDYFTEDHKRLLTLIASRVAIALENARLYTRATRQARSLAVLNEIARDLTSILDLDELLDRIGVQLKRLTDFQMFSVLLLDDAGTTLEHRFSQRYGDRIQLKHDIPLGEGLVGYAAQRKEPVVVADVRHEPRYINVNPETRSELVVPLIYKDKVIGVLDLEHTKRGYFTEQHVRTITTLAAQVAIAIENARLYQTVSRQEQQMERDLVLARELQVRVLPPCCPKLRNANLYARFQPARFIGGDLYDFVPYSASSALTPAAKSGIVIPSKRRSEADARAEGSAFRSPDHPITGSPDLTGFAIADVSGKGAPAAIYAALTSGFLRSHAAREPGAAEMMCAINRSLTERPIAAQYVSMTYALWDDAGRQLRIANSGLPWPIYCRGGNLERVESSGLPMGLFAEADYDEVTFNPLPGDVFVFFTDGILDASNAADEMFGRTNLEAVIARNCDRSAQEIVNAIFDAIAQHAAGTEPFDDATVVALKIR